MKVRECLSEMLGNMDLQSEDAMDRIIPLPITYMFRNIALLVYWTACRNADTAPDEKVIAQYSADFMGQLRIQIALERYLRKWLEMEAEYEWTKENDGKCWYETRDMIEVWNQLAEEGE